MIIPSLNSLLVKRLKAEAFWKERLDYTGPGESMGNSPIMDIDKEIYEHYPNYFIEQEEQEITKSIQLLKSHGYKILKPVVTTEYIEL